MKKHLIVFALVFLLCGSTPVSACESTHLTIVGDLDSLTPLASLLQIPDMSSNPSFADLEVPAHFSTSFILFDSIGAPHTVTVYFYHVLPRNWNVRHVVDGSEVAGGVPGAPAAIGPDSGLIFTPFGLRQSVGSPDSILLPVWSGGAAAGSIKLIYAMTQNQAASAITQISQNGRAGECVRRNDLDFDGDGIEDNAVWRPQFGMWAVLQSSTNNTGYLWKQWGLPGDYPMAGDYTGDFRADLVVWRPTDGNWFICRSETLFDCSQPIIQQFGLPGDRPIRGDYDGDGFLDFAVWRPNSGKFYFRSSGTGQITERQWGLPDDIPLNTGANR